jgi:hypothetical protein
MKKIQLAKKLSGLIVVCFLGFLSVSYAVPTAGLGTGCGATPALSQSQPLK